MKQTTYKCRLAELQDRANLYYISSPSATKMDRTGNTITITTRTGRPLAIFTAI